MTDLMAALSLHRIVPVVVIDDAGCATGLAEALITGGLPVAEVTFRTPSAAEAIRIIAQRGDVIVGAGTVLTPQQVDVAVSAGASFIVSPGFSRAVVDRCAHHGVLALPGAVTATEIQAALEAGLDAVKFFPAATSGGPEAIRALTGPFPDLRIVPTGGIGLSNLRDYLSIDAVVAVGGSWMVPRELIAQGAFTEIARLVWEAVELAALARVT
jgi:2-dehydro-3-deoxyphosphogluconate aldolase / (4S)-4-hydroxy-2-oxoglutarate aldolase